MTVPALMQNHQRKTYVTQLHKVYNEFQQAAIQYMTDNNAINLKEAGLNDINAIDDFIKKYFKIVQNCGANPEDCFAPEYKKISGVVIGELSSSSNSRYYVLASGVSIAAVVTNPVMELYVDTNGKKGPNIVGRDLFALMVYNNGVIDDICEDAPCTKEQRDINYNSYCTIENDDKAGWWWGCFGKILNDNWEMTY